MRRESPSCLPASWGVTSLHLEAAIAFRAGWVRQNSSIACDGGFSISEIVVMPLVLGGGGKGWGWIRMTVA